MDEETQKMKKEVRGAPPSYFEWIIICFVAGEYILHASRSNQIDDMMF